MASTTGTAVSLAAVYDALHTFITANGWTLYDTLPAGGTRDRLYTSTGTGGNLNMLYRLTSNAEAGNPWKNPGSYQVAVPQIIARGYHSWDVGTDTGTNEYGILDMMFMGNVISGQLYWYNRINTTIPMTDGTTPLLTSHSSRGQAYGYFQFDGRRRMFAGDQTVANTGYLVDMASPVGNLLSITLSINGAAGITNQGVWVWDSATNKEYLYYLSQNATLINQWFRYDADTNTNAQLAAPTWAASSANGAQLVWDGVDTIYAIKGNGTTDFSKYVISTNTWSNLTAVPVSVASYGGGVNPRQMNRFVFVPSTVTGFSSNVIYFAHNTASTIYCYNTTTNTWNPGGGAGANITSPTALGLNTHLLWDNQRYMYVWNSNTTSGVQMFRSDLTVAPGTFTNIGVLDNVTRSTQSSSVTNTPTASLRCSNTLGMTYWFVGDADSVVAVVRIGDAKLSAKYYWFRFGKYTSNYKTSIMTLTGTASPGVRATVAVDSTAGYSAGERVTMFDPSNSATEQVTIYDIVSATSFRVNNLVGTYTTGSKSGADVVQHILTGDSGFGTTALLSSGFKPDYLRPWYYVSPDPDSVNRNITLSGRGAYTPLDFKITNPYMTTAGTAPTAGNAPFYNCEYLGRIDKIYALPIQSYPAPQAEDTMTINGQTYMFFPQTETAWLATPNNMGIVVGPF